MVTLLLIYRAIVILANTRIIQAQPQPWQLMAQTFKSTRSKCASLKAMTIATMSQWSKARGIQAPSESSSTRAITTSQIIIRGANCKWRIRVTQHIQGQSNCSPMREIWSTMKVGKWVGLRGIRTRASPSSLSCLALDPQISKEMETNRSIIVWVTKHMGAKSAKS